MLYVYHKLSDSIQLALFIARSFPMTGNETLSLSDFYNTYTVIILGNCTKRGCIGNTDSEIVIYCELIFDSCCAMVTMVTRQLCDISNYVPITKPIITNYINCH